MVVELGDERGRCIAQLGGARASGSTESVVGTPTNCSNHVCTVSRRAEAICFRCDAKDYLRSPEKATKADSIQARRLSKLTSQPSTHMERFFIFILHVAG